jgi:hypothetical protein
MAGTPAYGLDAELARKAAEKYDPEMEKEVCAWISTVTGVTQGDATVGDWLHDGVVLCKLANAIKPGSVTKISESKTMVFKQRENITFFPAFCREVGVAEISMFGTDDLFDQKNMGSVISTIHNLGGVIQDKVPEFTGPKLGVAIHSTVRDEKRQGGFATQMGGLAGTMEVHDVHTHAREVAGGRNSGVQAPGADGADAAGLDADLRAKRASTLAQLGPLEKELSHWIAEITGDAKGSKTTHEWLKSGQVLCVLANKIKPGSVASVNTIATPFKERENINFFQKVMRDIGVPEVSMFSTDDLYDEKDLGTFLISLAAFAGAVQTACPDFSGPKLGPAMTHCMAGDTKRGDLMATSQTEAMQRAMQVERPKESGITAGAKAGGQ